MSARSAPLALSRRRDDAGGVRATILVCDDEDSLRALICAALAGSGHEIVEARNGGEALDRARALRPDLLLLDMRLPGRSGLEVLAELRADPGICDTPVIMLTAGTELAARRDALAGGAAGFLGKPFSPLELLEIVGQRLGGGS